jgi:hypothetical protein
MGTKRKSFSGGQFVLHIGSSASTGHFNVMGRSQSISNTSKWSLELIVAAPRWPRRGPAIVDPSCYAFKCDGRVIQCWVEP